MQKERKKTARQGGSRQETGKTRSLSAFTLDSNGKPLTSNQGVKVSDDQNSLKASERGPSLLEDFLLREKITHFDHERIPERVVHARGSGAHGFFQVYKPQSKFTKAAFLQDPEAKTPVFVRFSTVAGSRGSTDLARDVRGFAVKFYTQDGVFDLVGNNMPVFFIQDAIKFPDLIHAVKPEPDHEMPQAATAHDSFWDFASLSPESAHMIMWIMSDRALPRSYRMMEGFGVHTFRLVNADGKSTFAKFHWKPLLGVHSVTWDEAVKISGADPDFHRRDLWEAIEGGDYPEWEFGVQLVEEDQVAQFDFDLLDPTKIIPEELVPVTPIGKLTLDRNPDNFFAETEQVAFCISHIVPGIDFTDDPLLQGRLFSYLDTQLTRLGGPNFHELPINRSLAPVHNNQQDGHMRETILKAKANYQPNSLGGGCPFQVGAADGGFASFGEAITGRKTRARGPKFFDHFTQARMFYLSMSNVERLHMVSALRFELGKVKATTVRGRMLYVLSRIDGKFAAEVSRGLGLAVPQEPDGPVNMAVPADAEIQAWQPGKAREAVEPSPALSQAHTRMDSVKTRKVAVLIADGFDGKATQTVVQAITAAGARACVIAPRLGMIPSASGAAIAAEFALFNQPSVMFDAVFVPGGEASVAVLAAELGARQFIHDAYDHCKTIMALDDAQEFLALSGVAADEAIITGKGVSAEDLTKAFLTAMARHRFWDRELRQYEAQISARARLSSGRSHKAERQQPL